jgi:hypothetical protein
MTTSGAVSSRDPSENGGGNPQAERSLSHDPPEPDVPASAVTAVAGIRQRSEPAPPAPVTKRWARWFRRTPSVPRATGGHEFGPRTGRPILRTANPDAETSVAPASDGEGLRHGGALRTTGLHPAFGALRLS